MALPIAEWLHALEQMDASVSESARDLDHHEHAVEPLLAEPEPLPALAAVEALLAQIDERLERHDRGQKAAAEHVASFEHWLVEQEAAVGAWRTAFTGWCGRIQHSR